MNNLKEFKCPQEAFLYYVKNSDSGFTYIEELKDWMKYVKGLDEAKKLRTVKDLLISDKRFDEPKKRHLNKVDEAYLTFLEDYFCGRLTWVK